MPPSYVCCTRLLPLFVGICFSPNPSPSSRHHHHLPTPLTANIVIMDALEKLTRKNPDRVYLRKLLDTGVLTGEEDAAEVRDTYPRFKKYPRKNWRSCFVNTVKDAKSAGVQPAGTLCTSLSILFPSFQRASNFISQVAIPVRYQLRKNRGAWREHK